MAVDDLTVIDFVSVKADTGHVVLTISDHLEWDPDNEHLLVLQDKINLYLGAIENGSLIENYPDAKDRKPVINIVFKYQPNATGKKFLELTTELIEKAGYGFRYMVGVERL